MITDLRLQVVSSLIKAKESFEQSQSLRANALIKWKDAGLFLLNAKEQLRNATKNNPVEGYTSFSAFCDSISTELGVTRVSMLRYIELAELWPLAERINLLSHKNSFRLVASLKVLKWAKARFEEDPAAIIDAADFFKEQEEKAKEGKIAKRDREQYISYLESEVATLKNRLKELEKQLASSVPLFK